jgi:vancomycin aglycone glucosyltransferase
VAIEAIRAQGRRALVARGWADLALIDDWDDCFAVGEVNQQALFGRVAAVVHHGGAGTTTTAARAGTPQVVVPQMADQPYFAGRVAELGIGTAHDGPTPTTESLSAALKTTLTPRPVHERPPWPARSAPTGRRWPRRCCSTRSAENGRP